MSSGTRSSSRKGRRVEFSDSAREVQSVGRKLSALEEKLEEVEKVIQDIVEDIEEVKKEIENTKEGVQRVEREINEIGQRISQKEEEISKVDGEIEAKEYALEALRRTLQDLSPTEENESEKSRLSRDIQIIETQKMELRRKEDQLRDEKKELRRKEEQLRDEKSQLRGKEEQLREEKSQLRGKEEQLREEKSRLELMQLQIAKETEPKPASLSKSIAEAVKQKTVPYRDSIPACFHWLSLKWSILAKENPQDDSEDGEARKQMREEFVSRMRQVLNTNPRMVFDNRHELTLSASISSLFSQYILPLLSKDTALECLHQGTLKGRRIEEGQEQSENCADQSESSSQKRKKHKPNVEQYSESEKGNAVETSDEAGIKRKKGAVPDIVIQESKDNRFPLAVFEVKNDKSKSEVGLVQRAGYFIEMVGLAWKESIEQNRPPFPLMLGGTLSTGGVRLYLFLSGNRVVHTLLVEEFETDTVSLGRFFNTLISAVQELLDIDRSSHGASFRFPGSCFTLPLFLERWDPSLVKDISRRGLDVSSCIVAYRERVYKIYTPESSVGQPITETIQILNEIPNTLPGARVEDLGGGYKLLSYEYLKGDHEPWCVKQVQIIANVLTDAHDKKIIHGDFRLANMMFEKRPGDGANLIDWDFSGKKGTKYPEGYKTAFSKDLERALEIREGRNRCLHPLHDWYSFGSFMEMYRPVKEESKVEWAEIAKTFKEAKNEEDTKNGCEKLLKLDGTLLIDKKVRR